MTKNIIALIGLMGVGKTTLGSKLAKKLNIYFLDSDQEIEDLERREIKEIFAENGEQYFRKVEKEIIMSIIGRDEPMVISLGGGAFINDDVRNILKEKAITVWLDTDIETIMQRIGRKNNRPLLNQKDKRVALKKLYKERLPIYQKADIHIFVDQNTENDLLENLIKKIEEVQNVK